MRLIGIVYNIFKNICSGAHGLCGVFLGRQYHTYNSSSQFLTMNYVTSNVGGDQAGGFNWTVMAYHSCEYKHQESGILTSEGVLFPICDNFKIIEIFKWFKGPYTLYLSTMRKLSWWICLGNNNMIRGVMYLLPVNFHQIPFSRCRKVENILANRSPVLFSIRLEIK